VVTARAGASGLAIMLMSGADERAVVAIERLTKQKFEMGTVQPRRRERDNERRSRRDAPSTASSTQRPARPRQPVDDFFSRPYEPDAGRETQLPPPIATPGSAPAGLPARRPGGRVAALLGGKRK